MTIYERVKYLAINLAGSETRLAAKLGLTQSKLNRYLREKSPKIWEFLEHILEEWPEVSRDWLYFGEGEMIASQKTPPKNSTITDKAPSESNHSRDMASATSLEVKYVQVLEEVNALRVKIIELQEELLSVHRGYRQERLSHGVTPTRVRTSNTAAPLLPNEKTGKTAKKLQGG